MLSIAGDVMLAHEFGKAFTFGNQAEALTGIACAMGNPICAGPVGSDAAGNQYTPQQQRRHLRGARNSGTDVREECLVTDAADEQILGAFGALVWKFFPETRQAAAGLIISELERAIDQDRVPDEISAFEYLVHAVFPIVIDRLGEFPLEPDQLRRFCQFCRSVLSYSGPDRLSVDYAFNTTLLEAVDFPEAAEAVREVDPKLVEIIRTQYGKWKS
ncbi:hypothetical protein [Paractinoplanes ferrugineus]